MLDFKFTQDRIAEASKIIRPFIRTTPIVEVDGKDFEIGAAPLTLKLELFQHSGSFKARGAFTNLLTREVPTLGVVAASGGNHGAAVAYAAMKLGMPAKIFVPRISSPAKLQRIQEYGADLVATGENYADALAASERWFRIQGRYRFTHSIRKRLSWDRRRWEWNWKRRRPVSIRSLSQ